MAKILRPKITMSAEEKQAARANMDGQKLESSKPVIEEKSATAAQPEATPVASDPEPLQATGASQQLKPKTTPKNKNKTAKASEIDQQDEIDTHAVRLTRSIVAQARINVLLLPKSMRIKNMREYGDAALQFYEAHLRKTGKLPDIRQTYNSY